MIHNSNDSNNNNSISNNNNNNTDTFAGRFMYTYITAFHVNKQYKTCKIYHITLSAIIKK